MSHNDVGLRGVLVAPPSRNTSLPKLPPYPIVHQGFDTIALSIKQILPASLFDRLRREKERAETERREVVIDVEGQSFQLKPHGGAGYAFLLHDGLASASWAFKRPNAKDPWGIRVSIGSQFLATAGLGAVRAYIDDTLARLGIRYGETDVSIARVDYCVDILAPGFEPDPANMVMHSSTNRRDYVDGSDMKVNGKSGRVTSITVGGVRNRQVILYDKRAEIIARRKSYWWSLWYDTLRRDYGTDAPPLRNVSYRKDADMSRVWRVELRAGKDLLKDRWNIRTWSDLFDRYGSLAAEALQTIRYTDPTTDTNRARWPNHALWVVVAEAVSGDLFEMQATADPMALRDIVKDEKHHELMRQFVGTGISLAALEGVSFEALEGAWISLGQAAWGYIARDPERYAKSLADAKEWHVFV